MPLFTKCCQPQPAHTDDVSLFLSPGAVRPNGKICVGLHLKQETSAFLCDQIKSCSTSPTHCRWQSNSLRQAVVVNSEIKIGPFWETMSFNITSLLTLPGGPHCPFGHVISIHCLLNKPMTMKFESIDELVYIWKGHENSISLIPRRNTTWFKLNPERHCHSTQEKIVYLVSTGSFVTEWTQMDGNFSKYVFSERLSDCLFPLANSSIGRTKSDRDLFKRKRQCSFKASLRCNYRCVSNFLCCLSRVEQKFFSWHLTQATLLHLPESLLFLNNSQSSLKSWSLLVVILLLLIWSNCQGGRKFLHWWFAGLKRWNWVKAKRMLSFLSVSDLLQATANKLLDRRLIRSLNAQGQSEQLDGLIHVRRTLRHFFPQEVRRLSFLYDMTSSDCFIMIVAVITFSLWRPN